MSPSWPGRSIPKPSLSSPVHTQAARVGHGGCNGRLLAHRPRHHTLAPVGGIGWLSVDLEVIANPGCNEEIGGLFLDAELIQPSPLAAELELDVDILGPEVVEQHRWEDREFLQIDRFVL